MILFVIGFAVVCAVLLWWLTWDALTPAARLALVISFTAVMGAFAAYTLTFSNATPLQKWLFSFNSGQNPVSVMGGVLAVSGGITLIAAVVQPIPLKSMSRAFTPTLIIAAYPLLRYLISDAIHPTPDVMLDVLLLLALVAVMARLLALVEQHSGGHRLQQALLGLNGVAVLAVLLSYYPLPQLYGHITTQSTAVEFDGVRLVGYRMTPANLTQAGEIRGRLTWQLTRPPQMDYVATVALLMPDNATVIARQDIPLRHRNLPSTGAWFSDVTFSTDYILSDVPTPSTATGYRLTVVVRAGEGTAQTLPLLANDREAITGDTVALTTLPAVPESVLPPPATSPSYTFADGIVLAGYTVDVNGDTIQAGFWWRADAKPNNRYNQLLHIYPPNSDAPYIFDAPPFNGSLLTSDWFPGLLAHDERVINLPTDAPTGDYTVYTGLYNSVDGVRLAVNAADGTPLPDNQIPIHTFTRR